MLQLNLFHEQQQIQREKDYDPVRLTILGGSLIAACITVWALTIYVTMGDLRSSLATSNANLTKVNDELKKLSPLTDLPKIRGQAESLRNRIEFRALFATQLDTLRTAIPTNCQMRVLKTSRSMSVVDVTIPPARAGLKPGFAKRATPTLDMIIEVNTQASTKPDMFEIRDNLEKNLCLDPRFQPWIRQKAGETNLWSDITRLSSTTQEPKAGQPWIGIFEFKFPFALKDPPKDM